MKTVNEMTVNELVSELIAMRPFVLMGKTGERHYRAGLFFRALKAKCRHGEYERRVRETGYSPRHSQKLRQLAEGIEAKRIPLHLLQSMTFDQLYDAVKHGTKNERLKNLDAYFTPTSLILPLLSHEIFPEPIWEPAVGGGAIASCFHDLGLKVLCSDVKDWGYTDTHLVNFYEDSAPGRFKSIVTNPPFTNTRKWIQRCFSHKPEKIALLMPAVTLSDCSRVLPDSGYSLTRLLVFLRPPKFKGPSGIADVNHGACWYVFEKGDKGGNIESIDMKK